MDLSDDEAILEKFRETRDPAFFRSLLRRYQNRIYNAAFRILGNAEEAEDVVQDTCIKVHQSIEKFNKNSSFAAWIFRIAHNSCMDRVRHKQRKKAGQTISYDPQAEFDSDGDSISVLIQAADPGPGPAENLDHREQGEIIAEKLGLLPESQRAVLVLHDIEGFSYEETAAITGEKLGTVRSRIHYGRQKLRELLEPYFASQRISHASR